MSRSFPCQLPVSWSGSAASIILAYKESIDTSKAFWAFSRESICLHGVERLHLESRAMMYLEGWIHRQDVRGSFIASSNQDILLFHIR